MTLRDLNPTPRLVGDHRFLFSSPDRHVYFVDIGARGGTERQWEVFDGISRHYCFEPDPEESERRNLENQETGRRFFATALSDSVGSRRFVYTRFRFSSGFYPGNPLWLRRFPFSTLDVVEEVDLPVTTLDQFVEDNELPRVDFIKVDVEGAEFDVLKGALRCLSEKGVLGVKTELWWDSSIRGSGSFAEIDIFLRGLGFRFFDLKLQRYPRRSLPLGRLVSEGPMPRMFTYGQACTGDALYFRDPVAMYLEGDECVEWSASRLLRLCALLDVYDYGDSAIEILQTFRPRLAEVCDVDGVIQSLVPLVNGHQEVPYADYLRASNSLWRQVHRGIFGIDWEPDPS